MIRLDEARVARMTTGERVAQVARVGVLLRSVRPTFGPGLRVFWVMAFGLRALHEGEEHVGPRLSASEAELTTWVRAFLLYLLAAPAVPGLGALALDDADWALAQLGVTRAGILGDGGLDASADRRVEQLVARVVKECPREAPAPPRRGAGRSQARRSRR